MKIFGKKLPTSAYFLIISYIALLVWWLTIQSHGVADTNETYWFGIGLGILTILSGITGLTKAHKWGSVKSNIGRFIIFLSYGFIAWGVGTLIIGYFNLSLDQAYPYPSVADSAYILSWPLWFMGMLNLSKATGARIQFKKTHGKLLTFLIVAVAIAVSYYLLFTIARGDMFEISTENLVRLFFDFAYPVGDIVIVTSSLLLFGLSFNYLGGAFKVPILMVIFGFVLNYMADIIFTYINTVGTYSVGSWVDMLYATVFLILGLAVNLFDQNRIIAKQP